MASDPRDWRLCFIPDPRGPRPLAELAALGLEGGARVIQLRLKGASDDEWLRTGGELAAVCRRFGRPLIVNDRPDVALQLGAAGVHLGREDMAPRTARGILGRAAVIGISVTGPGEARKAREEGADYVAVSPVFTTPVKEETPPVGLSAVARVREAVDLPLLAIGGINAGNAASVIEAGADGIAVISAISASADPRGSAAELMAAVNGALSRRRVVH